MKKSTRRLGRTGQVSVEMVLMLVVSVGFITLVTQAFKSNEYFATLVSGPWSSLSGLIQNGVLGSPADTMAKHPNTLNRINSPRGDPPSPPPGT